MSVKPVHSNQADNGGTQNLRAEPPPNPKTDEKITAATTTTITLSNQRTNRSPNASPRNGSPRVQFVTENSEGAKTLSTEESVGKEKKPKKDHEDRIGKISSRTTGTISPRDPSIRRKHSDSFQREWLHPPRQYSLSNPGGVRKIPKGESTGETGSVLRKKQGSLGEKTILPVVEKPRSQTIAGSEISTASPQVREKKVINCQLELKKMTQNISFLGKIEQEEKDYYDARALIDVITRGLRAMNSKIDKDTFLMKQQQANQQILNGMLIDNTFDDLRRRIVDFYENMFLLKTALTFNGNQIVKDGQTVVEKEDFYLALSRFLETDSQCYRTLKDFENVNFLNDITDVEHDLIKKHFVHTFLLMKAYLGSIGNAKSMNIKDQDNSTVFVSMGESRMAALVMLLKIPRALAYDEQTCKDLHKYIEECTSLRKKYRMKPRRRMLQARLSKNGFYY